MTTEEHLAFHCTNKGLHPYTQLGELWIEGNPTQLPTSAARLPDGRYVVAVNNARPASDLEEIEIDDHGKAHLRCPRCPRHVQWNDPASRIEQLSAAGVQSINISHLP